MTNERNPLRIDSVGSFLCPPDLKEAMRRHRGGEIDDAALAQIQDEAIRRLIAAEEAHGLPVVGDGEFRRYNFNASFSKVAGMDLWDAAFGTEYSRPDSYLAFRLT